MDEDLKTCVLAIIGGFILGAILFAVALHISDGKVFVEEKQSEMIIINTNHQSET